MDLGQTFYTTQMHFNVLYILYIILNVFVYVLLLLLVNVVLVESFVIDPRIAMEIERRFNAYFLVL